MTLLLDPAIRGPEEAGVTAHTFTAVLGVVGPRSVGLLWE